MNHKKKWLYRGLQILFCIAMGGAGASKLVQSEQIVQVFNALGYPLYLMYILGVAYLLGIIGILQTKFSVLREWAHAGFTFALLGAFFSHLLAGDPISIAIPPLVLLAIILVAYFLEKQLQEHA